MWENQGLVLGMANLNGHYGLNSTWHILSAFTDLNFLPFWKTEMALNGLVSVVLAFYAGSRLQLVLSGSRLISHWIVLLLPFFVFRNLLSSSSTDIPAIVCTWFVLTYWLEVLERKLSPWAYWPVFAVLPFWIVILKTSSAMLLLIPVGILFLALIEQHNIRFLMIGIVGFALMVPWAIQNWLLTGYLVFPIKMTALGHPLWQVPIESIEKKFYLSQFGDFAPPAQYNLSWLSHWMKAQNPDSRVIILLAFISLVSWFLVFVFNRSQRVFLKVFLFFTILACLLSWFLTITEPRYGFGSLVFSSLFIPGFLFARIQEKIPVFRYFGLIVLLLQGFNLYKTLREFKSGETSLVFPAEVPKVASRKLQCGNFIANMPVSYLTEVPAGKPVFCWDCSFPCVPLEGILDSAHIFKIDHGFYQGFKFK
jgi:hypothetical protein